jgi:UPF0755 protein
MALQADPTVQYAIALKTGQRSRGCTSRTTSSPRPTTPISTRPPARPGQLAEPRSIEAALYPAKVPYLYFVAGPDGRHVFSRTYDEHRGRSPPRQ